MPAHLGIVACSAEGAALCLRMLALLAAVEADAAVDLAETCCDETSDGLVTITQVGDVVTIDGLSGTVTAPWVR